MCIFKNRPLALACIVFALVLLGSFFLESFLKWILLCVLTAVFLGVIVLRRSSRLLLCLCLGFSVLSLLCGYFLFDLSTEHVRSYIGQTVEVRGTVISREHSTAYSTTLRVKLEEIEGEETAIYAIVKASYSSPLQSGDRFWMMAKAGEFEKRENYDEELYYLSQGNVLVLHSDRRDWSQRIGEDHRLPEILFAKWNQKASYRLCNAVGGEAGALSAALLLGNRSFLSGETLLHFRRAGVSHLLALSGLHVSILIAFLELLMRRLFLPKVARGILIPFSALGYLFLTGFAPSTVRAVMMVCVLYLSFVFWSDYDSFTALCAALLLILFCTPYAVLDLSLWMSFLATASIVIFSPSFSDFSKRIGKPFHLPRILQRCLHGVVSAFFVGFFANLALLLLTALVYGEISITAIPATMLLSIPISILLPLSAISLALPCFAPICAFCGKVILWLNGWISSWRGILLSVDDWPTLLILLAMTLLLIAFAVSKMKRKWALILLPCLFLLFLLSSGLVTRLTDREPHVQILQNYGGEVVVCSQEGRAVAIDLSNGLATSATQILSAARNARCTELDDLILTRYYGRSPYVISSLSKNIRVHTLRLPVPLNETEAAIAKRLEQEARLHGIKVRYDVEDLAVDDLEMLCFFHTPMTNDLAAEVLVTLRANDAVMVLLNASLLEGEHRSLALNQLQSADTLLLAKRSVGTLDLPICPALKRVVLGDPEILSAVSPLLPNAECLLLEEPCSFLLN